MINVHVDMFYFHFHRATERKVTGDTEVFQEGALGTTPDG